ncbi:MAG: hypothetical protein U9N49_03480 [Campylobacterota bacterium]|nr:hypothetical protein [Campylobacterota bacterium]
MTKMIMSAVTASLFLTSSASAFETNTAGTILDLAGNKGIYSVANMANIALQRSFDSATEDRMSGDALIFPAYKMNENWETEVTFRNNYDDRGVVAKVVLYSGDTSREIFDFNVYLSANDQVRFVLDSTQTFQSKDCSIVTRASFGTNTTPDNTSTRTKFACDTDEYPNGFEYNIRNHINANAKVDMTPEVLENGYIVVYGIFETNLNGYTGNVFNYNRPDLTLSNVKINDNTFHFKHLELWRLYREVMDAYRTPLWRNWQETMTYGVYTVATPLPAPNLADIDGASNGTLVANNQTDGVQPVGQNALSGSVRIYSSAAAEESRDLTLPATALANYSDDTTLFLWAPTEYASIGDRCIDVDFLDIDPYVNYNSTCVGNDTTTFLVDNAVYTFKHDANNITNADLANTLLITQPTKRFLVQLFYNNVGLALADTYWTFNTTTCPRQSISANGTQVYDGLEYGIRANLGALFDDDENSYTLNTDVDVFSPYTLDATLVSHCDELTTLSNIELSSDNEIKEFAQDKNGFIKVDFNNGDIDTRLPAIITQMKATRVNGVAKTNWFYAPSNR